MNITPGINSDLNAVSPICQSTASPWNYRVDDATLDPQSAAIIAAVRAFTTTSPGQLHPDFGGSYGIPYGVVANEEPRRIVAFSETTDVIDNGGQPLDTATTVTMTHDNDPNTPGAIWFHAGDIILAESEAIKIVSVNRKVLTLERGYYATTAETHANGTTVIKLAEYDTESDIGWDGVLGYPIPDDAMTNPDWYENGEMHKGGEGDGHVLLLRQDMTLFEMAYVERKSASPAHWFARYGAIFDLNRNDPRAENRTSTDAAGMAVLAGLLRYDEVYGPNPINHALRCSIRYVSGHVTPATHHGSMTAGGYPEGMRFRLKSNFDIDAYLATKGLNAVHLAAMKKILTAWKRFGLIVTDQGGNMFCQGTRDTRWDNAILNPVFHGMNINSFEVVKRGWIPVSPSTKRPEAFTE